MSLSWRRSSPRGRWHGCRTCRYHWGFQTAEWAGQGTLLPSHLTDLRCADGAWSLAQRLGRAASIDDGHVPQEHPADANPIEEYDDEGDQSDDNNEGYYQKWRDWALRADTRPNSSRVPPVEPVDPAVSAAIHSTPRKPWPIMEQSIRAALAKQAEAGTTLPAQSSRRVSKYTDISIPKRPLRRRKHKQV